MKQKILQLFNITALLDKECLKSGQKHIQHSVKLSTDEIEWIDAAYIGTDGMLYFFITDRKENIKSKLFEDMNISDIKEWYDVVAERLDELMLEKYPHIVYTAKQSDEFLKKYEGDLADEDVVAWDFAEYVNGAEKFIIIKTIGKHDNFVEREFDDEKSAKLFVFLMRESEQHDFIRYRITKVINY